MAMIDTEKGRAEVSRFAIDLAIRIALLAGVVFVALLLLRPIAPMLLWAVILAVAVYPLFAMLRRRLGLRRWLAATLVSACLLVLVVAPVILLAGSAIDTLEGYARDLMRGEHILPQPPEMIQGLPFIGQRLHDFWLNAANDLRAVLKSHVGQLASIGRWVGGIAAGLALEILQFASAIIIAGAMLAYSEHLTATARGLAGRAADAKGRHFLEIAGSTIRNVSQGVIGIAVLQAALLGIGMLVVGVPFAGAVTFVALVLAIVQVGPGIVMLPVLIWAWMSLPLGVAAIYSAYTIPLLLVDNVLRPIVMARGLQTPMVVILAGVICGTLAGGLIGLFVGPVVLAVFYDLVVAWIVAGQKADPEG
jgi:predicted PurR-regulated permease PerM